MGSDGSGSVWYNELGSEMKIMEIEMDVGILSGTYNSAVGKAVGEYFLVGRFDTAQIGTIGWTVSYQNKFLNAHSVCSWSGQIQFDPRTSNYTILTTWLLTTKSNPSDNWESTNIGQDVFSPLKPSPEVVEAAKLRGKQSHPRNE